MSEPIVAIFNSDSVDQIMPAFIAAQKKFTSLNADTENPEFDSDYTNLATLLDTVRPIANEHDMAIVQGSSTVYRNARHAETTIESRFWHSSGQWIATNVTLSSSNPSAQAVGSLITYGKRYGLQALTGIAKKSEDDDGGLASKPDVQSPATDAATPSDTPAAATDVTDPVETQPPAPAATQSAQHPAEELVQSLVEQIGQLPEELQARSWTFFKARTGREKPIAADVPMLQLTLARANQERPKQEAM